MLKDEVQKVSGTVLGTFDIFRGLDIETREVIAEGLQMHRYAKGQFVISSRNKDTDVHFLVSGRVRVCTFANSGKQIHFDELVSGMMFGELSAIDGLQRSSDCISMEDCIIAVMSDEQFHGAISKFPQVRKAVLLRLTSMIRGNMQKVFEFSALSVPQRVQCELLRLAADANSSTEEIVLDSAPTHAEIAARVSTHREAVTRELKTLEAAGLITWKKNNYVIHDAVQLSSLAFT